MSDVPIRRLILSRRFLLFFAASLFFSLSAAFLFVRPIAHAPLSQLQNFAGPTAESLLHGAGLTVVTEGPGTVGNPIAFHGARMPVATFVVAGCILLFGSTSMLLSSLVKTVVFLVPVWLAAALALRRNFSTQAMALLFLPFLAAPFLADAINLHIEEAYAYAFIALAAALLFFAPLRSAMAYAIAFACVLDCLFLCKSSLLPAVLVLFVTFLWRQRSAAVVAVTTIIVCAAPVLWAVHQHHATGHFIFGTTLDGDNLHKGNNARFLERYPPQPGTTLDRYDPELNHGLYFPDEWSFDQYHRKAAVAYIRGNPSATLRAAVRKTDIYFLSLRHIGSSRATGARAWIESAGVLLLRLFTLAALAAAASSLITGKGAGRYLGAAYVLLAGACAAPYIAGFAYTRHASIMIYPAALFLVRCLPLAADDSAGSELRHP